MHGGLGCAVLYREVIQVITSLSLCGAVLDFSSNPITIIASLKPGFSFSVKSFV